MMEFGTSVLVLVVSIRAVLSGGASVATGIAIGSNTANTTLVLGTGAITRPLSCDPRAVRRVNRILWWWQRYYCACWV